MRNVRHNYFFTIPFYPTVIPAVRTVEVRRSDWDAAVNEHRKVHLLGPAAVEAYVQTKQVLADALPTKKEVCD